MALAIIGSGFGRTGTSTLKDALEGLGFGPTHHMTEIMKHPEQLPHWKAVFAKEAVNWEAVFEGYASQVDWSGASVWERLMDAFPNAKIIHTERPEAAWWDSFSATIGLFFARMEQLPLPPDVQEIFTTMAHGLVAELFDDVTDRQAVLAAYRRNNARVRARVPADRLLIYNVADGWEPLCTFLGVPQPATPFPHNNVRKEFWAHFGGEPLVQTAKEGAG
ncbi:MAG: sulfotransferase family protein [Pseudomonadota bacterium]